MSRRLHIMCGKDTEFRSLGFGEIILGERCWKICMAKYVEVVGPTYIPKVQYGRGDAGA